MVCETFFFHIYSSLTQIYISKHELVLIVEMAGYISIQPNTKIIS